MATESIINIIDRSLLSNPRHMINITWNADYVVRSYAGTSRRDENFAIISHSLELSADIPAGTTIGTTDTPLVWTYGFVGQRSGNNVTIGQIHTTGTSIVFDSPVLRSNGIPFFTVATMTNERLT